MHLFRHESNYKKYNGDLKNLPINIIIFNDPNQKPFESRPGRVNVNKIFYHCKLFDVIVIKGLVISDIHRY